MGLILTSIIALILVSFIIYKEFKKPKKKNIIKNDADLIKEYGKSSNIGKYCSIIKG